MDRKKFLIATIIILLPSLVSAQSVMCSISGYTILTINGIFTDEKGAIQNKNKTQDLLSDDYRNQRVFFDYLHNPSHLGGLGDIAVATYQKYFEDETVTDYDLVEMLRAASDKVKTQKVLLVAHSQGNFYANSFYDSVAGKRGGLPTQSVGVYGVATPASRVAGGGKWLTSSTDKVISGVVVAVPGRAVMPPNTNITLQTGDDKLGHKFSEIYLKYRGGEIVSDIQKSLGSLSVSNTKSESERCIDPPKLTTLHKIASVTLAVLDPAADITVKTASGTLNAAYNIAKTIADASSYIGVYLANNLRETPVATVAAVEPGIASGSIPTPGIEVVAANVVETNITEEPTIVITPSLNAGAEAGSLSLATQIPSVPVAQPQSQNLEAIASAPSHPQSLPDPFAIFAGVSSGGMAAGFGGGSPPPASVSNPPSIPAPDTPSVSSPADLSQIFSTTSISFSGTTTPGVSVSAHVGGVFSTSTTSNANGEWSLPLVISEGSQTISFYANNSSGTSSPFQTSITVDSSVPVISSFSVNGCSHSYCGFYASSTPTLSFSWAGSSTASNFELLEGGISLGTSTATTSTLTRGSGVHDYELRLYSSAGVYTSTTTRTSVSSSPYPLRFTCSRISAGAVEGETYLMDGPDQCWFELLSVPVSGEFMGFFMRGVPGGSALIRSPYLGTIPRSLLGFPISINEHTRLSNTTAVDYFAAVARGNSYNELINFSDYLTGASTWFPNSDFGIVRFKLTGPN